MQASKFDLFDKIGTFTGQETSRQIVATNVAKSSATLARLIADLYADDFAKENALKQLRRMKAGAAQAVPDIIYVLRSDCIYFRQMAAYTLAGIGPAAVSGLRMALADPRWEVRHQTVTLLGWMGPVAQEAIPWLEKRLLDEDERVRAAAQSVLKRVREE